MSRSVLRGGRIALAVGLLSLAPAPPVPAQTVEVGEVCGCGVLITKLVRKGIIAEEDANDAWLECIEEMC